MALLLRSPVHADRLGLFMLRHSFNGDILNGRLPPVEELYVLGRNVSCISGSSLTP